MGKESVVEIPAGSGNKYRYVYDQGSTKYLGPVGSAPEIGEAEFLKDFQCMPSLSEWKTGHGRDWKIDLWWIHNDFRINIYGGDEDGTWTDDVGQEMSVELYHNEYDGEITSDQFMFLTDALKVAENLALNADKYYQEMSPQFDPRTGKTSPPGHEKEFEGWDK